MQHEKKNGIGWFCRFGNEGSDGKKKSTTEE
jgi:hypothetical protein